MAACSPEGASPASDTYSVTDSAGIEIVTSLVSREDLPSLRIDEPLLSIGEAEGTAEQLLSRVGGSTRIEDSLVALADNASGSVRIYDHAGRLVSSFGRRGEGPREFLGVLGPWEVKADEARLAAYDFRGQRVTSLTSKGEFLGVRPLRPRSVNPPDVVGVLDDLTVVHVETAWLGEPGEVSQTTAHVVVFGPPEWTRDTVYSGPSNHRGLVATESGREVMISPLFDSFFSAASGDSLIVVTDCSRPEYRAIDASGRIRRIVRWAADDLEVQQDDVEAFYEKMTEGLSSQRRQGVVELLEASPVRGAFPTCDRPHPLLGSAVRVGANGEVWIREYVRPSDQHVSWLRFRDGIPRARLLLDVSMAVQEFGRDYLLTVERDELDVERVREYEIPVISDPP